MLKEEVDDIIIIDGPSKCLNGVDNHNEAEKRGNYDQNKNGGTKKAKIDVTILKEKMIAKELEKLAKIKLKEEEKIKKEQLKEEEKRAKERLKEEERIKKEQQKEDERLKREKFKEEERIKKEMLLKEKEEERLNKERLKEAERIKRESEIERKRLEKEELEKKRLELIEKQNKTLEKQKVLLRNFFKPTENQAKSPSAKKTANTTSTQNTTPQSNKIFQYKPFVLKRDMKLAPLRRRVLENDKQIKVTDYLTLIKQRCNGQCPKTVFLTPNLWEYLSNGYSLERPELNRTFSATSGSDNDEVMLLDTSLANKCHNNLNIDYKDKPKSLDQMALTKNEFERACYRRVKYLHFHTNHRPPYYGTWRPKTFFTQKLKLAKAAEKLKDEDGIMLSEAFGLQQKAVPEDESGFVNITPIAQCDTIVFYDRPTATYMDVDNDGAQGCELLSTNMANEPHNNKLMANVDEEATKVKQYVSHIKKLGRCPFKTSLFKDVIDYTYDSDDDWEEEEEMGESLHSNDEKDKLDEEYFSDEEVPNANHNTQESDKELDEYSSDEGFIVEHGYLSEDEYRSNHGETATATETLANEIEAIKADDNIVMNEQKMEVDQSAEVHKAHQKVKLRLWKESLPGSPSESEDSATPKFCKSVSQPKLVPTIVGPVWSPFDAQIYKNEMIAGTCDLKDRIQKLMIIPLSKNFPIDVLTEQTVINKKNKKSMKLEAASNSTNIEQKTQNGAPEVNGSIDVPSPSLISKKGTSSAKKILPKIVIPHLAKIVHGSSMNSTCLVKNWLSFVTACRKAIDLNRTPPIVYTRFELSNQYTMYPDAFHIVYERNAPSESHLPLNFELLSTIAKEFPKQHILNTIKHIATYETKNLFYHKPVWYLTPESMCEYFPTLEFPVPTLLTHKAIPTRAVELLEPELAKEFEKTYKKKVYTYIDYSNMSKYIQYCDDNPTIDFHDHTYIMDTGNIEENYEESSALSKYRGKNKIVNKNKKLKNSNLDENNGNLSGNGKEEAINKDTKSEKEIINNSLLSVYLMDCENVFPSTSTTQKDVEKESLKSLKESFSSPSINPFLNSTACPPELPHPIINEIKVRRKIIPTMVKSPQPVLNPNISNCAHFSNHNDQLATTNFQSNTPTEATEKLKIICDTGNLNDTNTLNMSQNNDNTSDSIISLPDLNAPSITDNRKVDNQPQTFQLGKISIKSLSGHNVTIEENGQKNFLNESTDKENEISHVQLNSPENIIVARESFIDETFEGEGCRLISPDKTILSSSKRCNL